MILFCLQKLYSDCALAWPQLQMGQSLSVAARWTSSGSGPRGSLEYNKANELILNKFVQYCESFSGQFPEEAKVVYKQPLTWKTELKPSDFSGLTQK